MIICGATFTEKDYIL